MSAFANLRFYLLEDDDGDETDLAELVGSRVYPDALPQAAAMPAVVYYGISGTTLESLAGIVADGELRIQFDAYANTRKEADEVAAAIIARLKELSQEGVTTIGDDEEDEEESNGTTRLCDVEVTGPRHDRQPPADGSDDWRYITSVDAMLTLGT
jgi:hypothetical protein